MWAQGESYRRQLTDSRKAEAASLIIGDRPAAVSSPAPPSPAIHATASSQGDQLNRLKLQRCRQSQSEPGQGQGKGQTMTRQSIKRHLEADVNSSNSPCCANRRIRSQQWPWPW